MSATRRAAPRTGRDADRHPPAGITDAIEQLRITDEVVRDSVRAGAERGARNKRRNKTEGRIPDLNSALRIRPALVDLIFLKPLFLAELEVARAIKALAQGPHPLPR